jgi:hypothetical protein
MVWNVVHYEIDLCVVCGLTISCIFIS